ncbi:MAG: valine--tRNA ligase [Elusimicrobiota bacterium]|jgi:valyl-tRNA synthetase
MELPKTYNPEQTELPWYPSWEEKGYFKPKNGSGTSYSIVIPPPNVTGSLHMGHALNNTLQDLLIRQNRMAGARTLWVPGTDHGGIATQNVVEKLLRSEKKTRHELGREKFLERMWQWRREAGDTILMQLKRLGASLDWSRTRFTMDEVYSRSVRHAFVSLFDKGLIYRGPRMVNWCPRCHTALADIEVEHEEKAGKLWHIRYPLDKNHFVVVATTRPETMLGDTAVAVNPEDPRYKAYIGKKLRLPLMNREIPIVADTAVDASFGTGAVKVTPAHDPTDFEIGERHKLPQEVVINFVGKMTERAGAYAGMDRFDARKKIVEDLDAQGLLEKVEEYRLSAAVCYRCQTIIEPLISEQWFLKMGDMAARAAQATRDGRVKIFPSSWEKPYLLWLENIRDWCISRQIWWGHRIPVYYCNTEKGRAFASEETPTKCPSCGSTDLKQDEDVLDTWFSSALWPLTVLGWPDETDDLKSFYPTSVLVTGHEILYLWVARMVVMGLEFRNDVPFRHVYIHGIVRDKQGKKMSKSLGNVIDPLGIMKQYGTDALRFSLAESSIPGRDMHLSNDSFLKARNFANKLWNASRFVLMNLDGHTPLAYQRVGEGVQLGLADRWILHALQETIEQVTAALAAYNPAEACRALYEFIWGSLCDWYVEISKVALTGSDAQARSVKQSLLVHLLSQSVALLHPVMPYETEELFQALRPFLQNPVDSLMIHPWPAADKARLDQPAAEKMALVKDVVTAIRTLRSESVIPPGIKINCSLLHLDSRAQEILNDPDVKAFIVSLARLEQLETRSEQKPSEYLFTVFGGGEIYIAAQGVIDKEKEKARLQKNKAQLEQMLARGRASLENKDFLERAPKEEVESRRVTLRETEKKLLSLDRNLEGLA